jgi:hypothetical protein
MKLLQIIPINLKISAQDHGYFQTIYLAIDFIYIWNKPLF